MRCHVCNVAVGDGQRFCHECGESLAGVTDRTEPITGTPDDDAQVESVDDPESGDDGSIERDESTDDDGPPTEEVPIVSAARTTDTVENREVDETREVPEVDAAESSDAEFAPTEEVAAQPTPASADTEPLQIVEATPVLSPASSFEVDDPNRDVTTPAAAAQIATTAIPVAGSVPAPQRRDVTAEMPVTATPVFDGISDVDEYRTSSSGFRLRLSLVFAILAVVAAVMAGIADTIDIRTSRPVDGIAVGIRALDDFGSNLVIAGFIGVGLMLTGAFMSCFGLRWGAGLAGGSGLALAGWTAMTIGLVEVPIHTAEGITRSAGGTTIGFDLSITRDIGWFLVVALGVLGLLVFATSLRMAGTGGRPGLNPWVAAVGAVGAVILAAGPLITLGGGAIDLNLGFVGLPRAFFAGRLVQLGLIAFAGVIGFLSVRTYGLGLVGGGLSIATWLWATSIAEFGEQPVSVAVGNLGTTETIPHAVTSVGLAVSLVMLAVAATLAAATRP